MDLVSNLVLLNLWTETCYLSQIGGGLTVVYGTSQGPKCSKNPTEKSFSQPIWGLDHVPNHGVEGGGIQMDPLSLLAPFKRLGDGPIRIQALSEEVEVGAQGTAQ